MKTIPPHLLPMLQLVTTSPDGGNQITPVDSVAPEGPRERAICRALLLHALAILDATEPTNPNVSSR
ncbi:hypothetical protein [Streptomyces sp. cmx-4-9]|uniref:hypothetical protein n=1 Tax=Streptomyces sp. cmx-4-9 TaxID=2790941 RepID=UPI00397FA26F